MIVALLIVLLAGAVACAAALALALRRAERRTSAAEAAIGELTGSWSEDGSSRGRVCSAARLVAGARVALLAEPTGRGMLRITGAAGARQLVGEELALDPDASLTARAFSLGAPISAAEPGDLPDGAHPLVDALGARAAHAQPVRRNGRLVGVLTLVWEDAGEGLDDARSELVAGLADEAARAIERDAHVALLSRQARTDELTALPNRRAWDEAVVREMARAGRTGEPLCVALLDLDHFKGYNDRLGHQAGDAHLRRTATLWRRELRTIDVLARYGGEEFGVLLPNCDVDRAREVIDRVRAATPNGQTASAGVVVYDLKESPEALVARADAALYQAKHAGRSVTVPA